MGGFRQWDRVVAFESSGNSIYNAVSLRAKADPRHQLVYTRSIRWACRAGDAAPTDRRYLHPVERTTLARSVVGLTTR
jgi:hypothetical protein